MKKQIFILVFLVMATFANVTNSYGQCIDDALHPIAGKEYSYGVNILPAANFTNVSFEWFVTSSPQLVGATIIASGTSSFSVNTTGGSTYNSTTGTTALIKITWTPELIAAALAGTKYYIAVKYTGTTAAACNASNIKAYKVTPINLFQLDLAVVDAAAAIQADGYTVCPSNITSALINETTEKIVYNYGTNDLYVKVSVKNFIGDWKLLVNHTELAALASTGETFTLAWGNTIATATNVISSDAAVTIAEQDATSATATEVIYLKLTYAHGTYEGLTAKAIAVKVNATDKALNPDVSALCVAEQDVANLRIGARPEVTTNTTATPNTFILP